MVQPFLWINNTTTSSRTPNRPSKKETSSIRSHAQCHRQSIAASPDGNSSQNFQHASRKGQQQVDSIRKAYVQSSQPSKALGRLASETRKRSAMIRKEENPQDAATLWNFAPAVAKSLHWSWLGLCSNERRSLAFFELRTAREWSGWEDLYFWETLVLQVSQQNISVARSLIAVSCLHEEMETTGDIERTRLQSLMRIQSVRATEALTKGSELSYFEALVSCIIMICFHGIRHSPASFLLLKSGLRMVEECRSTHVSVEERELVDKQLRPLISRITSKPCRMVEMGLTLKHSIQRYGAQNSSKKAEFPLVPTSFRTLDEAKDSLQQILDWGHDHVPLHSARDPSQEPFPTTLYGLRHAWESAIVQPNLCKGPRSNRSRNLLIAACIVGVVLLVTADCHQESVYDDHEQDFERAISLIEQVRVTRETADFGIDSGLIDIIVFLGNKCRHPKLRRRALQLLGNGGRIEGDRIASNPATILQAFIALEERGLTVTSSCDIPESNRLRLVYGQQFTAQRRIELFYETADGLRRESSSVSLAAPGSAKMNTATNTQTNTPNAIFSAGHAAYLEDWQSRTYFRVEMDRFYFPIPKG